MDDAEIVLMSMGTTAATVRKAVDEARAKDLRVGALRVRMFRPFPERELRAQLAGCKRLGVIDRDISLGLGGVLWSEARSSAPSDCLVQNYMLGLGGGDIRPEHITQLLDDLRARDEATEPEMMEVA